MLSRGTQLVPRALFQSASRLLSSNKDLPIIRHHDAKKKELDDILEKQEPKLPVTVSGENEASEISGVPLEHQFGRTARIFKPSRAATQTAWNNTKIWKIELDNRGRWENPLMGWSSTGDPLSNISMQLDFASKEDAVEFCEKNNWSYDVEEASERQINPKNYGSNFSWNRRTKISTK